MATSSMSRETMVSSRIQLQQQGAVDRRQISRRAGPARRALAWVSPLLLLLSSLLVSSTAAAAGARVGVPKFKGAHEALVRKEVAHLLKAHGHELVGPHAMEYGMSTTSATLDSADGRKALAKELSLSAIVTADVGPKRAKIVVYDGSDGSSLGEASFSGANPRKLAHEVKLTFWKKLGSDVARGHLPAGAKKPSKTVAEPEEEEKAEGGEAEPSEPKDERPPTAEGPSAETATAAKKAKEAPPEEATAPSVPSGRPWVHVEVGGGGLIRTLTFNQNVTPALLSFKLPVGPIAVANLVVYPFDPLVGGPLGNIGLEAEIQQGFAISSTLTINGTSTNFPSVVHDYAGGVRYRIPFSAGADDVYLSVTGGEDAFTFTGRTATNVLDSPDTIYHYVRPGAGLHLALTGGFSVAVGGGYRVVLNNAGAQFHSSPFFPRSNVAGADAEVDVRYAISPRIQLRAGLEWRRYWFTLNAQPGDTFVAQSAVDQSFAFTGRIAFFLGGSSVPRAEGGEEEAPQPPPPPKPQGRGKKPSDEDSGGDGDSAPPPPSPAE